MSYNLSPILREPLLRVGSILSQLLSIGVTIWKGLESRRHPIKPDPLETFSKYT